MRRLVIDGRPYLWRRTHRHSPEKETRRCEELLRVFAEGNKKAGLQINFCEKTGWQVGYPEEGVVWSSTDSKSYNLNRPAVVRALIIFMLHSGWDPHRGGGAVNVHDGIPLLASSEAPVGVT
jgi:hypothetical protein